ncbi:hypothetical protein ACX0HA_11575 [Flavobacterium hauense]
MEDLLKEDEFVPQRSDYNPWKLFMVFYGIAVLQIVAMQWAVSFWLTDFSGFFMGVIYLLLPLLMVVLMFTFNPKSFLIERKEKVTAILGLIFCFSVTNLIINLVKVVYIRNSFVPNDVILQAVTSLGYFVVMSAVSCGLVYIISGLVKRRTKRSEFKLQ